MKYIYCYTDSDGVMYSYSSEREAKELHPGGSIIEYRQEIKGDHAILTPTKVEPIPVSMYSPTHRVEQKLLDRLLAALTPYPTPNHPNDQASKDELIKDLKKAGLIK